MADFEKVITGLECCSVKQSCSGCPWMGIDCNDRLHLAALELLKEQQEILVSFQSTINKLTKALAEQPEQKFFVDSDGKMTPLPIQPQWISVDDRMPDKQPCEYLVVNANNVETAICLDNRWITPRRVIKITHWMPMPKPPEVEQDD